MGKALPEERVAAVKIKMEVDAETKIEVETDAHAERAWASDRKALKSHETAEHVEEWRYAAVTVSVLALASSPPPPIPGERARLCLALPSLASAPVHHWQVRAHKRLSVMSVIPVKLSRMLVTYTHVSHVCHVYTVHHVCDTVHHVCET